MDSILPNAATVRSKGAQDKDINKNVCDILSTIKGEIDNAFKEGKHEIIYTLPIQFEVINMDMFAAQRSIYTRILEALVKKNYRVGLVPPKVFKKYSKSKEKWGLKIKWISKSDEDRIKKEDYMMKKYIINNLNDPLESDRNAKLRSSEKNPVDLDDSLTNKFSKIEINTEKHDLDFDIDNGY